MKFTLVAYPRETHMYLYLGDWLLPVSPAIILQHGTTPGEKWYPMNGARIGVYYNYEAGGYEIGRRSGSTKSEPVGWIYVDEVEVLNHGT